MPIIGGGTILVSVVVIAISDGTVVSRSFKITDRHPLTLWSTVWAVVDGVL